MRAHAGIKLAATQASGRYPGEPFYKDPIRGDVDFKAMMAEREEAEEREKNPKAGSEPGCPGCKN